MKGGRAAGSCLDLASRFLAWPIIPIPIPIKIEFVLFLQPELVCKISSDWRKGGRTAGSCLDLASRFLALPPLKLPPSTPMRPRLLKKKKKNSVLALSTDPLFKVYWLSPSKPCMQSLYGNQCQAGGRYNKNPQGWGWEKIAVASKKLITALVCVCSL